MTEGQFLTMLRNRGVIPTTLIDQIRAQIAWQGIVQLRVRPSVVIPPEAVEEVVTRLAARRGSIERRVAERSEEHTSELQSLMRNSYAVFCLKKKKQQKEPHTNIYSK